MEDKAVLLADTTSHQIMKQIIQSKNFILDIFSSSPNPIVILNKFRNVIYCNQAAVDLSRLSMDQILNLSFEKFYQSWNPIIAHNYFNDDDESVESEEFAVKNSNGNYRFFIGSIKKLTIGSQIFFVFQSSDITNNKQFRENISKLFQVIPIGILNINRSGFLIEPHSDFTKRIFGKRNILNKKFGVLFKEKYPNEVEKCIKIANIYDYLGQPENLFYQELYGSLPSRLEGMECSPSVSIHFHAGVQSGILNHMVIILQDISALEEAKRNFQFYQTLSLKDGLTKLNNRRSFDIELSLLIEKMKVSREDKFSLLLMDVDNFKKFNDYYGHVNGDQALISIGKVVLDSTRACDLSFRYGGEEFAVLIKSGIDSAVAIAKRILDKLKNENIPHKENPPHNYLSISIGLISSEDLKDLENICSKEMVEKADKALYHAKDLGRNTFVKFSQLS